ncbi:ABC transporter substrate-binding protein [Cuneatibacter caecimuris]|uniref:Oligogalacturonide transport system substrate-binding protein n=1 Tax=Cuneatibacter caecimuris TaxID=1796618 RepID=A0A4Q7P3A2_9FIRM|nr:ABC transporter substrate-binding protein [Cuneatibacter caecimuris]RZS94284.1 oligogalacturonide transport system substrate-binding protein [Cuneatibacter caecimuris]
MKRKMMAVILAASLALSLTACGGSGQKPAAEGENTENTSGGKSEVNLRFSWWGGDDRHEKTLQVIDHYETKHPGVTIAGEYGGFDGYLEKLTTQLAANTAPDIIQIDYAYLEALWKTDDFVDFTKTDAVDLSDISQALLDGVTSTDGRLIGIPSGINFTVSFANKAAADQYGVDLTKQFTWERVLEEGKRVHEQDENAYLFYSNAINRYIFEPYLFNLTGKKLVEDDYSLGFDRDSLIQTYEYVMELYENGVTQPYDDVVGIKSTVENPLWLNNKIVFAPHFSSEYDPMKASLKEGDLVSLVPMGDSEAANTGIVMRPTNMIAVNAKSPHLEEALDFVNYFFNDPEAQRISGMTRSVPATGSALDIVSEEGLLDDGLKEVLKWCEDHKGGQGQNVISTNTEIETIENDVLNALYYGELTPETAADEFIKLMTKKVAELKESYQQ